MIAGFTTLWVFTTSFVFSLKMILKTVVIVVVI